VPEERAAARDGVLSLDLAPLKRFLEEHAALQPPGVEHLSFRQRGGATVDASIAFLHRLRSSWTGAAERGFVRLEAGHALDAVIGLHALHYVLAGNADFGAFMQRIRGNAITLSSRDRAASWTSGADSTRPQVLSGHVLDQSLGGYRLHLRADGALRIRVGEVIGLAPFAEAGEPQEWMTGLIRWLRTGSDGMYAGVELLARRARAAGVRLSTGGDDELHAPQRAVLMPERGDANLPCLLVTHLFDLLASEVEVTTPPDPADWTSSASVLTYAVAGVEELSSVYYRVALAMDAAVQENEAAPASPESAG
jgi:hypothetical protein